METTYLGGLTLNEEDIKILQVGLGITSTLTTSKLRSVLQAALPSMSKDDWCFTHDFLKTLVRRFIEISKHGVVDNNTITFSYGVVGGGEVHGKYSKIPLPSTMLAIDTALRRAVLGEPTQRDVSVTWDTNVRDYSNWHEHVEVWITVIDQSLKYGRGVEVDNIGPGFEPDERAIAIKKKFKSEGMGDAPIPYFGAIEPPTDLPENPVDWEDDAHEDRDYDDDDF
jgi:hypothetical protein